MKIVCISDLHTYMAQVVVPPCDLVICSGDVSFMGEENEVRMFLTWFSLLPVKHRVFVAGNHDFLFEKNPVHAAAMLSEFRGITYLENSSVIIDGLKIWGSPWTPEFHNWAFNANSDKRRSIWSQIPDDVDILITHGPPMGILDKLSGTNESVGCPHLAKNVVRIKPKLHVFGHIHEGYGMVERDGVIYINASTCNLDYKPVNKPVIIDIEMTEV